MSLKWSESVSLALGFVAVVALVSVFYFLTLDGSNSEPAETEQSSDKKALKRSESAGNNQPLRQTESSDTSVIDHFQSGPLPEDSYLQVTLEDGEILQTRTLKISAVEEAEGFTQYEFESTEGEVGVITVSPERVFAFIQANDGVYEYAGESFLLTLQKSRLMGGSDDVYRRESRAIER